MSAWVQTGDGLRCERHGLTFGRLDICARCVDDPADLDDGTEAADDAPTPEGCRPVRLIESTFIRIADLCERHAATVLDNEEMGWHRYGAATKLIDSAIKSLRAAGEHAKLREQEHAVESRMRRMKAMNKRARH